MKSLKKIISYTILFILAFLSSHLYAGEVGQPIDVTAYKATRDGLNNQEKSPEERYYNSHEQALEVAKLVFSNTINLNDYLAVRSKYNTSNLDHKNALQTASLVNKEIYLKDYLAIRDGLNHQERNPDEIYYSTHKQALEVAKLIFLKTFSLSEYLAILTNEKNHKNALQVARLVNKEIYLKDYLATRKKINNRERNSKERYSNTTEQALEVAKLVFSNTISLKDYLATREGLNNQEKSPREQYYNTHEQALEIAKLVFSNTLNLNDYLAVRSKDNSLDLDHKSALQVATLAHLPHKGSQTVVGNITLPGLNMTPDAIDNSDRGNNKNLISGISAAALLISPSQISNQWESVSLNQSMDNIKLPIMALVELNKQAAHYWKTLMNCYSNIPNETDRVTKLINDYLNKSIQCGQKQQEIEGNIQALVTNVKRWLGMSVNSTAETIEYFINMQGLDFSTINLPPLHPLLGQIVTEIYANSRVKLAEFYVNSFANHQSQRKRDDPEIYNLVAEGNLDLSNLKFSCIDSADTLNSEESTTCSSVTPLLMAYYKIEKLFKNHNEDCQNYGFYPNASLYMYSNLDLPLKPITGNPESAQKNKGSPHQEKELCWEGSNDILQEIHSKNYQPIKGYNYYLYYSDLADFYDNELENLNKNKSNSIPDSNLLSKQPTSSAQAPNVDSSTSSIHKHENSYWKGGFLD